jgi:hypothetical protein
MKALFRKLKCKVFGHPEDAIYTRIYQRGGRTWVYERCTSCDRNVGDAREIPPEEITENPKS